MNEKQALISGVLIMLSFLSSSLVMPGGVTVSPSRTSPPPSLHTQLFQERILTTIPRFTGNSAYGFETFSFNLTGHDVGSDVLELSVANVTLPTALFGFNSTQWQAVNRTSGGPVAALAGQVIEGVLPFEFEITCSTTAIGSLGGHNACSTVHYQITSSQLVIFGPVTNSCCGPSWFEGRHTWTVTTIS